MVEVPSAAVTLYMPTEGKPSAAMFAGAASAVSAGASASSAVSGCEQAASAANAATRTLFFMIFPSFVTRFAAIAVNATRDPARRLCLSGGTATGLSEPARAAIPLGCCGKSGLAFDLRRPQGFGNLPVGSHHPVGMAHIADPIGG